MSGPSSSKIADKDPRGAQGKSGIHSSAPSGDQMIRKREKKMNEKLQELIEKEKKMTMNEFLNERELKIQNRNSILQSGSSNFLKVL